MKLHEELIQLRACSDAVEWAKNYDSFASAWKECERGDWMLWLCGTMQGKKGWPSQEEIVLVECDCAELVLPIYEKQYPNDSRIRDCIETTRQWAKGEATEAEREAATWAATGAATVGSRGAAAWAARAAGAAAGAARAAGAAAGAAWAAARAAWAAGAAAGAAEGSMGSSRGSSKGSNFQAVCGHLPGQAQGSEGVAMIDRRFVATALALAHAEAMR